jgi:hypothetical protein
MFAQKTYIWQTIPAINLSSFLPVPTVTPDQMHAAS